MYIYRGDLKSRLTYIKTSNGASRGTFKNSLLHKLNYNGSRNLRGRRKRSKPTFDRSQKISISTRTITPGTTKRKKFKGNNY